ncbi:AMP-dependent synthetase/ligase [Umezawaea tangerina]|uniref:Acyl-CoA synthetase n=1 Tax=Umezawaea tangerina TaxID=84725 RepID=A0A2T0SWV4_9PSEU|nr:AMP-dependent synthetase/ligase [Umezawaea tangerina]PRY37833.1 long-chain acyl-CoA synthetase [Umezawaea tangerina]
MSAGEDRMKAAAELTIPLLLHRNATEFGDLPALGLFGSDEPPLTWLGVRDEVAAWARGLGAVGLAGGDRMIIMMSARPEHWVADLAAVHLGAVPCSAYDTLSSDQVGFLGRHSKAPVVVLEGAEQLARWRPVLDDLPDLKVVLVLDEDAVPADDPRIRSAREVVEAGRQAHEAEPEEFGKRWREITPEQPVTLLYTSGTTGDPKGVVISHRNAIHQAASVSVLVESPEHAATVSYLPLAHVAERVLGIYIPVYRAGHVTICPDPAKLVPALVSVRPVSFFGVPRVWEKLVAGVQGMTGAMPEDRRAGFAAAHAVGLEAYDLVAAGEPVPEELARRVEQADAAVLKPVRAALGLDNLGWAGSGAAPIPYEVLRYLGGLGVRVLEVWGMTETTGTATLNTEEHFRPGSVGKPNIGMEVKLADDGEILVRGGLNCLGYLQADGSVAPVTDADGWLPTGDIGVWDADGFLTITDRKKDLIITSAGKNIPPARIESLLRAHPLVGGAAAIGDRRPYVTALVVLDEEAAPAWARAHGVTDTSPEALAADPLVLAEIDRAVAAANEKLSRPEQVKKFVVLPRPWTVDSGELTPTLKVRRRVITDRFAPAIEDLYR